ncbi:hypothetical protein ACNPQM_41070 [Streptomyces sp. NPDC056231]|uniref:hypothetical protein n=1 Tax=Streptomyces sp. NPDC056231 TaxID=3345755 RepID=UPI003AACFA56
MLTTCSGSARRRTIRRTRAQQRDNAVPLAEAPDGHRAMDHRSALKVRVTF